MDKVDVKGDADLERSEADVDDAGCGRLRALEDDEITLDLKENEIPVERILSLFSVIQV